MSEAAESAEVNVDTSATEATDGNVHSFDDLDSMTETRSDSDILKEAVKEVKDSNEKVAAEVKEASNATKEAKAEDQELQQDMADQVEAELVEEIKKLNAKFNDENIEIPEQAVLTVKVDGEEIEVPIADLRNNYSGKTSWERKFNELSEDKKLFNEDKQTIERYVMEFGELSRKGDKIGAMQYLAQLSGADPLAFRRELRDQVLNEYKAMLDMDETQRKAFDLEEENKFLRESKESEVVRSQREQEILQARQQVTQYQEALGIDEARWEKASQELIEEGYSAEEVTPDAIGQYVYATQVYESATSALEGVSAELAADNEKVEAIFDIINQNPDFTQEDLAEIITETWGEPKKAKSGSKKAAASAKKPSKEEESKSRNKLEEFYASSFDDL